MHSNSDTTPLDRHPYRLALRADRDDTVVRIGEAVFGGTNVGVIAGPCAVEDRDSLLRTAMGLRDMGVQVLRGGAFKPRTSPYAFQGLAEDGLRLLAEARELTGMAVVTEVLSPEDVELVAAYADALQIGTRNMANYRLLQRAGASGKPVVLKRGMGATVEELLCAAEYILATGNPDVVLCERGVRSFDPLVRNALDINAFPLLRSLTHLPVIADPSHAAGRADLVHGVSLGAIAAGAHGLLVEVHESPQAARVDGEQSLDLPHAAQLVDAVRTVAEAVGNQLSAPARTVAA